MRITGPELPEKLTEYSSRIQVKTIMRQLLVLLAFGPSQCVARMPLSGRLFHKLEVG